MKKLCKNHHIKHEHKLCKAHSPNLCEKHKPLAKTEGSEPDGCKYCAEMDQDRSSCVYCQEYDSKNENHDDCPMCIAYDQKQAGTGGGVENCPYCQEQNSDAVSSDNEALEQQSHQCNCPNCPSSESEQELGLQAKDTIPDANHPENCPECQKMFADADENSPAQSGQEPPKTQGHETAEEVLDMLDQEPGQGIPPEVAAKEIDNTEMPQGDAMEDGTSVPENFGPAITNDVSDEEQDFGAECNCPDCPGHGDDQPDMADVLRGGLDDHANEQKKAQVIDMVAQTLQGFKANKEFLEQAKESAPGLYQSSIGMLKAMIALCDLLGIKPKMEAQPMQAGPAAPMAQSPDQSDLAAPQEGQSDPKAPGQE